MKNIKNKSINLKVSSNDGIRICVMRRIRPEYKFDIWLKALSPSEKLLREYVIDKKISWDDFCKKYTKSVVMKKSNQIYFKLLKELSKNRKITLLCGEKSAKHCHRSLIINAMKLLNRPYLKRQR